MRKEILEEYIDACELVKETEEDIKYLKKKKQASVLGEGTVNPVSYTHLQWPDSTTSPEFWPPRFRYPSPHAPDPEEPESP